MILNRNMLANWRGGPGRAHAPLHPAHPVIALLAAHEAAKDSMGNVPEDGISRTHATLEYMRSVTQTGVPSATLRLYVANSRTTGFATLGLLHAPLPEGDAPGGRPTFINCVLQRVLPGGVLCWWARPVSARRSAALQSWAAGPARWKKARPRGGARAARSEAARPATRHARSIAPEDCAYADGAPHAHARGVLSLFRRYEYNSG